MKNKIIILPLILVLSGCATSTGKPVEVTNADRAAGVVTIGFVHDANIPLVDNGSKAHWEDAVGLAKRVCGKWGYDSAELLTPHARVEGIRNMYGQLFNGSITKQYQCLNSSEKKVSL